MPSTLNQSAVALLNLSTLFTQFVDLQKKIYLYTFIVLFNQIYSFHSNIFSLQFLFIIPNCVLVSVVSLSFPVFLDLFLHFFISLPHTFTNINHIFLYLCPFITSWVCVWWSIKLSCCQINLNSFVFFSVLLSLNTVWLPLQKHIGRIK